MSISSHISLNRNWFQYYECWQKRNVLDKWIQKDKHTHIIPYTTSVTAIARELNKNYIHKWKRQTSRKVDSFNKNVRTVCNTGDRVFNNLYNPWTRWYTFIGLVFSFKYVECCESHHLYECLTTESCDLVSVAYHGWRTVHSARLNNKFTLLGL